MIAFALRPLDTLFFRDGTPFDAGSTARDDVGGVFPPWPPTVVGAIRAALARSRGWPGTGRWDPELDSVLGDGPDDLGALRFSGPLLLRGDRLVLPVPRHLLGTTGPDGWTPACLLAPGPANVTCDLGEGMRMPTAPADAAELSEAPSDLWITEEGLRTIRDGGIPDRDALVETSRLWSDEQRVGLEREPISRTAVEGRLYRTRHVRLADDVALAMGVEGLPADWMLPEGAMVPLGGEGRLCTCHALPRPSWIDTADPPVGDALRLTFIALTPLILTPSMLRGAEAIDPAGSCKVTAACIGRPSRMGGWSSLERRPLPTEDVLPAGSVLFCERADAAAAVPAVIGARAAAGFGRVAVGGWSETKEDRFS